ncbi:glycosyltransferase family 2 protein [Pelagibacteraceae bacterium]|nr:glycosyltransferase family 2 protein [Pelagibacteraceae bacterium]
MKKINNSKKNNLIKKLFIKLCRLIGFEIIDQSNLNLPVSKKTATDNLGQIGKKIITLPLGETKISRPVKSLDIIIKTCTSINLVTQNKKRIFEKNKSDYTFRTINSLINSLNFSKNFLKDIDIKIYIIDDNSKKEDLEKIRKIIAKINIKFEIINLDLEKFKQIKILNKNNPAIEKNMRATMASILTSFNIAKEKSNDLVYFVEDDYIHKKEAIIEMVSTYEKIATELDRELFLCPVDYPYLYKKLDNSNILIGNNYHWRTINESLLTFLTSKDLINKYWNELLLMAENEHSPFETPLHKIYEKELCLSPIPSLAMHCTNINSIFGLSPNMNWKKLWDENEI